MSFIVASQVQNEVISFPFHFRVFEREARKGDKNVPQIPAAASKSYISREQ